MAFDVLDQQAEEIGTFHPSVQAVLRFFRTAHLPDHLAEISRDFADLALKTARRSKKDPETTVAIRKLLEAKDAAVRAALEV